jgi:hypothetical protein
MKQESKETSGNGSLPVEISLGLAGDPVKRLEQGKRAAAALMTVARPVMISGRKYLRFEDLQTIGAFFGTVVGTSDPEYVEVDGIPGYKAHAVVRRVSDGLVISSASAYCLREGAWKDRENYALASMAQTRAGAKALRNSFAWIVTLAGFEPTPAEEMTSREEPPAATERQLDYIAALAGERYGENASRRLGLHLAIAYGKHQVEELTRQEASELIDFLRSGEDLFLSDEI